MSDNSFFINLMTSFALTAVASALKRFSGFFVLYHTPDDQRYDCS